MDVEQLQNLYSENPAAKVLFDHMAGRDRNQSETKVHRILLLLRNEGQNISRGQIVQVLKRLEELGCGQFLVGRHGWPSRFVWSVGSLGASRAALGEGTQIQAVTQEGEEATEQTEVLSHVFNLRPDMKVTIDLPSDLSHGEAERLAAFMKTLPMEDYD